MNKISTEEIRNALIRSGYLLEIRVLDKFTENGFWSEASHRFLAPPFEDKFREIDVIATKPIMTFETGQPDETLSLYVHFICECINIPVPLALFESKGDMEETSSDWNYKFTNGSSVLREIGSLFWPSAIERHENKIFDRLPARQYCGFAEKKNGQQNEKWMAYHPDDFHNNLLKLVSYIKLKENEIGPKWEGIRPQMARLDINIPIIVLQGEMIEIKCNTETEINNVNYYRLKVPFESQYNKSLSIDIITEDYLLDYLDKKIVGLESMFNDLKKHIKETYI